MGMKQIWDGKELPPVGCEVLIQLGSLTDKHNKGGWVRHKVASYEIRGATCDDTGAHHRIFINVLDSAGYQNQRLLRDVKPIDWREPVEQQEREVKPK